MIERILKTKLQKLAKQYSVITLTGPRQSGKTTLCQMAFPDKDYVSLESLESRRFATEDPIGFLKQYSKGAIFDEVQRCPDLPSYLQEVVDKNKSKKGLYILTGSQNFELMQSVNQSLAGRTALLTLLPFSFAEIPHAVQSLSVEELLLKGFYPRVYDENLNPTENYSYYFRTYIERDLRQLTQVHDLMLFEKFVRLCAGRIGQLLNLSGLANDTGISHATAQNWFSILEASYVLFRLPPYHQNFNKRLTKSSKLYFYDVGLACYLLDLEEPKQIFRDPLKGALFENLIVTEFLKQDCNQGRQANLSFYRDSNGNEVDLIVKKEGKIIPTEIKSAQTVDPQFFTGLKKFAALAKNKVLYSQLIYGGQEKQNRTELRVLGYQRLVSESGE